MNSKSALTDIKYGLALVMLGLLLGIGLGIAFGIFEDAFKNYVAEGIVNNPLVHDEKSQGKIWRYAQRMHFHSTGIAAFSLGVLILITMSTLKRKLKKTSAVFIGLSSLYPMSWFTMFLLAPSIGRNAAHNHILTEMFTYIGVGGLVLGLGILLLNIFFGLFEET